MNTVFLFYESETHGPVRVPFCRTELGENLYRRDLEGVSVEVVATDTHHWFGRVIEGETTTNYYGFDASVLDPCFDRILERHPRVYQGAPAFELDQFYPRKKPLYSPFGWMTPSAGDEPSWTLEFPDGSVMGEPP